GETRVRGDEGVGAAGKVVSYKFEGDSDDEVETFLLGARENEGYVDGVTVFSPQAPLGAALLGAESGTVVEFTGPNGRTNKVEVVSAVPYRDQGWRPERRSRHTLQESPVSR